MSEARYITPETLRNQRGQGQEPLVIDVRGADEYAAGHVAGAIHIPADELEDRLGELPRGTQIATC